MLVVQMLSQGEPLRELGLDEMLVACWLARFVTGSDRLV
jgi:hypothetical protein